MHHDRLTADWPSAGTGSFGRVKLVRSATDGRFYALKVLRKTDLLRLKQVGDGRT